jgi:hypothetical protein
VFAVVFCDSFGAHRVVAPTIWFRNREVVTRRWEESQARSYRVLQTSQATSKRASQRARRSWGCVFCSGTLHSYSMAGECKASAVMRRAERRSVSFQACKPRSCGTVIVACYILHRNAFLIRTTSRLDEPGIGHNDIPVFRETGSM